MPDRKCEDIAPHVPVSANKVLQLSAIFSFNVKIPVSFINPSV